MDRNRLEVLPPEIGNLVNLGENFIGYCKIAQNANVIIISNFLLSGLGINSKCCIKCGNHKFRHLMHNINDNEVATNHAILKKTYGHCVRC